MWSSRVIWKLFLVSAGVVIVAVGACVTVVTQRQEAQLFDDMWQRLSDSAILIRGDIGSDLAEIEPSQLQAKIRGLGQATGLRITVLDENGKVLAESDQQSTEAVGDMENHLSRKEFVEAARNSSGRARRTSPTWGSPFLYFALAIKQNGKEVGFVRTALPVAPIREQVADIRKLSVAVGLVAALVSLVAAHWLMTWLVAPIATLTTAAGEIAAGKYPRRVHVSTNDEFAMLARSFEQMVSELGARESMLRESVQHQTTVLGGMVEGVIAVDADQHVLFANIAAGANLGFTPDSAKGLPLLEVVRSYELRELVHQSLESGLPVRGEIAWHFHKKNLSLDVHATPIAGAPPPGVVLVLHDVTELKRLEGLRQQFVANVSHDLKTPLSSIKAYTETLLNGALDDPSHARHFLTRIDEQASRLHELILDLLSLARIESGQADLEIIDLPLKKVVAHCLRDHEERAKASGLAVENQVDESPLVVRADEEGLQQILSNLIDNAIKYTPAGGTITIRCREEAHQAVIEVADTGVGIGPEHHSRLFERFYRVDKARSRELGGTGLGLAIVKHLCQAMQGTVYVESTPGEGSVFGVRLPVAREQATVNGGITS
jgi:two-component system, OmpR family, phosphate regulon sensor histidine kinase PhoR